MIEQKKLKNFFHPILLIGYETSFTRSPQTYLTNTFSWRRKKKENHFYSHENRRKEATSAKLFKKFFSRIRPFKILVPTSSSTSRQISWLHNAPMHIDERLGCTAESGIWGHAYEAFKGGVHGARFFPCSLSSEARVVVCENTPPVVCSLQFSTSRWSHGRHRSRLGADKSEPFEKSDST